MTLPQVTFDYPLPLGAGVTILEKDANGLVAFNKPPGVLSHPNQPADNPKSLLKADYSLDGEFYYWREAGGTERRLWLLNRLDSGTSGVILLATSAELAESIRLMFREKHIRKVYQAVVFGQPMVKAQHWRDMLSIQKKGGQIRTRTGGQVKAEASMLLLRSNSRSSPPISLIQLEPLTGRSHQLRVQCTARHLPIVGDATYGNFSSNRSFARHHGVKRLCLHSHETVFDYVWNGRTHTFMAIAPTPKDFLQLFH